MLKSVRIGCRNLLLAGTLVGSAGVTAQAAPSTDPSASTAAPTAPALPTVVRFDPGAMPEIAAQSPPLGWRYAALSQDQTKALRRGFKLPLDALSAARSTGDLLAAAKTSPLPDPTQPLLVVGENEGSDEANPFGPSRKTSFRDDPMRALGEMLAEVDGVDPAAAGASSPSEDPFSGDPAFSSDPSPAADASAEVEAIEADDDPFGGDEDPFGDF